MSDIESAIDKLNAGQWYFLTLGDNNYGIKHNGVGNYWITISLKKEISHGRDNCKLKEIMHIIKLGENYIDILPYDLS